MRVEQEGTGFTPITITLETKEEADIMWAALNVAPRTMQEDSDNNLEGDYSSILHRMWDMFDDIYPTGW